MTSSLILYGYYYRYKQVRKSIKDLVSADNFSTAKTFLDSYKAQHDNYVQNGNISTTNDNFTALDNRSIHHASDHLDVVVNQNPEDQIQKQATLDALDEA